MMKINLLKTLRFGANDATNKPKTKVAIIGAGNVGCSAATSLVHLNACDEVTLFDIKPGVAEGKGLDLTQMAAALGNPTKVFGSNNYAVIDDADVVVVTAGRSRQPGENRDVFLTFGTQLIGPICEQIKKRAPMAKVVMVSNPMDIMAYTGQKLLGFPANRVMGMGGLLDSSRMQEAIATQKSLPLQSVKTLVVGEHGDHMLPMFRLSTIDGKRADKVLTSQEKIEVAEATIKGGSRLTNLLKEIKSASAHAPGAAIARMVQAILKNTQETIPCSVQLNDNFEDKGIYIGVPAVIGQNGVEEIPRLKLTKKEKEAWNMSVAAIRENIKAAEAILAQQSVVIPEEKAPAA